MQYAFKDSMTHRLLQFALHIAVRCVLHRFKSQDIHREELLLNFKNLSPNQLTLIFTSQPSHPQLLINQNDPSAGSPTETLLRLHLPLDDKIYTTSLRLPRGQPKIQSVHRIIQSVGATGGVYKGQGRNQRKLMTCIY